MATWSTLVLFVLIVATAWLFYRSYYASSQAGSENLLDRLSKLEAETSRLDSRFETVTQSVAGVNEKFVVTDRNVAQVEAQNKRTQATVGQLAMTVTQASENADQAKAQVVRLDQRANGLQSAIDLNKRGLVTADTTIQQLELNLNQQLQAQNLKLEATAPRIQRLEAWSNPAAVSIGFISGDLSSLSFNALTAGAQDLFLVVTDFRASTFVTGDEEMVPLGADIQGRLSFQTQFDSPAWVLRSSTSFFIFGALLFNPALGGPGKLFNVSKPTVHFQASDPPQNTAYILFQVTVPGAPDSILELAVFVQLDSAQPTDDRLIREYELEVSKRQANNPRLASVAVGSFGFSDPPSGQVKRYPRTLLDRGTVAKTTYARTKDAVRPGIYKPAKLPMYVGLTVDPNKFRIDTMV